MTRFLDILLRTFSDDASDEDKRRVFVKTLQDITGIKSLHLDAVKGRVLTNSLSLLDSKKKKNVAHFVLKPDLNGTKKYAVLTSLPGHFSKFLAADQVGPLSDLWANFQICYDILHQVRTSPHARSL